MIRTLVLAFVTSFAMPFASTFAQTQKLTVYTYDAFAAEWGPGPQLESAFEAECGCDLEFVALANSIGALRRAQLEKDDTQADIILGLDTATMAEARATGLFTDHDVDLSGLDMPIDWTAKDFVPFDYGYFAFVYRKADLPNPPSSFEDLAGNDDDLRIVIQDPRASTPGLGLVLWLKAAYGDDTEEAWPEIAPHVVTITSSWSDSYGLFLQGEADMVLSYTTSPAYHLIAEEDDGFASAAFDEGHYLQVEVAGILASSPRKDLARAFLQFLVSEPAQAIIPTTNWMYPVAPVELPKGFETLHQPDETLLLPEEDVAELASEWTAEMLSAFK